MGFFDAFKDIMNMAQKVGNIELYRQLLDLGAQALELQAEVVNLREENTNLKQVNEIEADVEYHVDAFVTRTTDEKPIKYCAACWVDKRKLVPIQDQKYNNYTCPLCKAKIADMSKYSHRKQTDL